MSIKNKFINYINFIDIKYIYIFFLLIIFFLYGLILSEIIDFIFPNYDNQCLTYEMLVEIIGETGIAYLIYYSFKYYIDQTINLLFKNIDKNPPSYLNQILLFSFSFGIFKHLQKSNFKINHFKNKIIDHVNINYLKNYNITLPTF
jgi:hypothetical protein